MFFHKLLRGLAGHDTGAVTPHEKTISGVSSHHRQGRAAWTAWRDVQGIATSLCSDVDGVRAGRAWPIA